MLAYVSTYIDYVLKFINSVDITELSKQSIDIDRH